VLICVSFLLALFLNHSAGERQSAPKMGVPAEATAAPAVPVRALSPAVEPGLGGGGAECRDLVAAHAPEPGTAALVEERCPNRQP
jgi:hypothetical protein